MVGLQVDATDRDSVALPGGRRHRRDIDGLRAIAVLAVLLAHAGFDRFSGGWVGVDVFFVISGFLITGILLREHREGVFSFRRFWMRRVRRILPALAVVVVLCFPFAWYLMFPDYVQNFGQSAVATVASANNLLLAMTSGYWDLDSQFKPLLHTWSLGVEEQFYVAYPLLFAAVYGVARKRPARVAWVLAVLAVVSLSLAELGVRTHPDAAFYLPHYRAWELLVGALAAFVRPSGRRFERLLPTLGVAAIIGAILFYTPSTPSPSSWMLLPVLGAAVVLAYGESDPVAARLLSLRPMVVIGLISYSAYLIHQPVFVFIRLASLSEPSPWLFGVLIPLVLGLAWLSWRFIEEPFRDRRRTSARVVVSFVVAGALISAVGGMVLHFGQGFPQRVFPNISAAGDVYIGYNERVKGYSFGGGRAAAEPGVIVVGNSFGRDVANVLLEGDPSIAEQLAYYQPGAGRLDPAELSVLSREVSSQTVIVLALERESGDVAAALERQLEQLSPLSVVVIGTKDFGWNLSPFARVAPEDRPAVRADVSGDVVELNNEHARMVKHHVDIIRLLGGDGATVPVFDGEGNPLTPDRRHLTKYGAEFLAEQLISAGVLVPGSAQPVKAP